MASLTSHKFGCSVRKGEPREDVFLRLFILSWLQPKITLLQKGHLLRGVCPPRHPLTVLSGGYSFRGCCPDARG